MNVIEHGKQMVTRLRRRLEGGRNTCIGYNLIGLPHMTSCVGALHTVHMTTLSIIYNVLEYNPRDPKNRYHVTSCVGALHTVHMTTLSIIMSVRNVIIVILVTVPWSRVQYVVLFAYVLYRVSQ